MCERTNRKNEKKKPKYKILTFRSDETDSSLLILNLPEFMVRLKYSFSDYEFLHQLPADLLQDIESEPYETPTRTDIDAVNAFRRIYDDFFERLRYSTALAGPQTGRKRVPPTKPYVLFLFLYDQLKREAKRLKLEEFEVKKTSFASIDKLSPFSSLIRLRFRFDTGLQSENVGGIEEDNRWISRTTIICFDVSTF